MTEQTVTKVQTQQSDNIQWKKDLRKIAYILDIIFCVFLGVFIIPLAWTIPMTISAKKKMLDPNSRTLVLGVFTLLFFNIFSGILLIIANNYND